MFNNSLYLKVGGFFIFLFLFQIVCIIRGNFIEERVLVLYRFRWLLSIGLEFSFFVDKWGLVFSLTVRFISMNVLFFSKRYIEGEVNNNRFIGLIFLFILRMNILIFFPNIIFLMLG